MNFYALDIETESTDSDHPEYALQPWRVKECKARISLIGFKDINTDTIEAVSGDYDFVIDGYRDTYVWTWNGVFDIAFLIASGINCSRVRWLDGMSLHKWISRSQHTDHPIKKNTRYHWTLENAAKALLKNWASYADYIDIKKELLDDHTYWLRRCLLDVEATSLICETLWSSFEPSRYRGFLLEQKMMYPTALAWVQGCRYNMARAGSLENQLLAERDDLLIRLNVDPSVLSSPAKLAELIYDSWGAPFDEKSTTATGKRSVAKGVIQFLVENHSEQFPQLKLIQEYRKVKTNLEKFISGPNKVKAYLGKETFHHNWRINSTYTGRCTVTSKCKRKFSVGLPLHQMPKFGDFRKFIIPPAGYCFIVADVDSQETKLMADASQDAALLHIYAEGLNPHGFTASKVSGIPYDEIMQGKSAGDERLAKIYAGGKVVNLGENYRMGAATLYDTAHTQWGLTPTLPEVKQWLKVWRSTYKGVIRHWDVFIERAYYNGYAQTLAGRRFYISEWNEYRWKSQSSAIMTPIQGSGADMKYLAIACMRKVFPKLQFWGEIHDEIIYLMKVEGSYNVDSEDMCHRVKKLLDNLPYKKAWGWKPTIPFTWSVSYGLNWKEQTEV